MNKIIKNFDTLATSPKRRDVLTVIEAGLQAIDTASVIKSSVLLEENILTVQGRRFDLTEYEHVYVIGFGKVACTAVYTLEQILADRIKDGVAIGTSERTCQVVDTYAGTHPLPSRQNYTATKHIEEVARSAKENDLVLVVVSGGGSAHLCSTLGECDQGIKLFESFQKSGGTIEELNTVRKHISNLKGGGLAKALYPATVIGLIFSDVPGGDMASVASGPTFMDTSTIHEAKKIIEKYDLGSYHLIETPKDPKYFEAVNNFVLVSNVTALNAMQQAAKELYYRVDLVSATQYATAEETCDLLLGDVTEGMVRCMGGETKLSVPKGSTGVGGRNSHLTLSMLESLASNQVFVSIASDGQDNTEAAGSLADYEVLCRARQSDLSVQDHLSAFNSFNFFKQLNANVLTGPLESNVSDLILLLTAHSKTHDSEITNITAEVVQDSRGEATLSVTVWVGNHKGTFSVPSGASTGEHEVATVAPKKAIAILQHQVKPVLMGKDVNDQAGIDATLREIDGTDSFANIGGNLALGVSVAACKAAAATKGLEVWQRVAELFGYREQATAPRLFVNLINGGKHAKNGSPIQEYQIIPETVDVEAALEAAKSVQRTLHDVLSTHYEPKDIKIGDEGGFVFPCKDINEPLVHITSALMQANTEVPVVLGIDVAASSFYKDGQYLLNGEKCSVERLMEIYHEMHKKHPVLQMVEDPYEEHDFGAFASHHKAFPGVLTIGDDLTTTNKAQLQKAIDANAINAIIIKPNQIGTLSDTLATMRLAYENKIWCIVSHRSGETEDDFIADLAFGTKCFGLKAGAPSMSERASKYNRLLKIQKNS